MSWTPVEIAYGIRHNRLFGFLGRAGDAIDTVLALQGTGNIPHKCFTRVGWPEPVTAMVIDDDENYRLTFNIDGIVLVVKLSEVQLTVANVRDMFTDIVNAALRITSPGRKINRIGIVEIYDFMRMGRPGEVAANTLTRLANLGEPTDFSFRAAFRKSSGAAEGDWWNTILQVAVVKKEEDAESADTLRVSIDYQHYFVPDVVFSADLARHHYANFYTEAEALQRNQLAGLRTKEPALGRGNG
jgi:hypothetical protein